MSNVRLTASGVAHLHNIAADKVTEVTRAVHREAKRRCPEDTGELQDSIEWRVTGGTGRVSVGTDHWAPTEYGSRAHKIKSKGSWPLRNRETGQVFGREVYHPGTPEQPFMRPALYRKRKLS